jgi:hypothetical protein
LDSLAYDLRNSMNDETWKDGVRLKAVLHAAHEPIKLLDSNVFLSLYF